MTPMLRALEIMGHKVTILLDDTKKADLIRELCWLRVLPVRITPKEHLWAGFDCGFSFQHPGTIPPSIRETFHSHNRWHEFTLPTWTLTSLHEVEYFMEAARMLGWVGPPPPPYLPQEILGPEHRLPQHIGIAVGAHIGADWYKKMWPWQSWKELMSLLVGSHYNVVIYGGGEGDRWQAETIAKDRKKEGYRTPWILDIHLRDVTALLQNSCKFMIGNDTGIVHIAAALNIPTLTLYGPTMKNKNKAIGLAPSHTLTSPLSCVPCYGTQLWSKCNGGCMQQITPESVFRYLAQHLA